jgi:hypothetical protein
MIFCPECAKRSGVIRSLGELERTSSWVHGHPDPQFAVIRFLATCRVCGASIATQQIARQASDGVWHILEGGAP